MVVVVVVGCWLFDVGCCLCCCCCCCCSAAKGSFEKSVAIKDCHQSSAEVMAVFKDCNQTLPKVLLE